MQLMTDKEIKAMLGTEFTYVLNDYAELPAVFAFFDPIKAFTCLATSLIDSSGDDLSGDVDDNGNLCVFSLNPETSRTEITRLLTTIKCLGYCNSSSTHEHGEAGLWNKNVPVCNY